MTPCAEIVRNSMGCRTIKPLTNVAVVNVTVSNVTMSNVTMSNVTMSNVTKGGA
jgi:hypothetical protein